MIHQLYIYKYNKPECVSINYNKEMHLVKISTRIHLQSLLSGSLDLAHLEQSRLGQNNQGHIYSGCLLYMSHGRCTYLHTEDQCKHCPEPRLEVPYQPNKTPGTNETSQICKIIGFILLNRVVAYKLSF